MISETLRQAREFEEKYLPYALPEQPKFHVTGGVGWINDPNGFAPYKNEYHLFFQYYPYDTKWGPMHWGHVKTKDFIRWEHLPCAMAPDQEYDRDGCFSGSAVELPDGRHLLMYTGVRSVRSEDGKLEDFQRQCIAIGDGIDYEKIEANPVIDASLLPEGGSEHDFRDPKIWMEDGIFYAVIGNRTPDDSGAILLYKSEDAVKWEFVSFLSSCHNQYGKMWECPDFFELDGKHVLLTSPQDMTAIGLEFHPGNANIYILGSFDKRARHLKRQLVKAIDYGMDFYAPQTLLTEDNRRVMIAWMQNWETATCKLKELHFFGQMTLPRELSIRKGLLCQNPVRELEAYRGVRIDYQNVLINGEASLRGISGRCLDMTVTIRPGNENSLYKWFRLYVAQDGEHYTFIRIRPDTGTVKVDRTHSGFPHDIVNVREFPANLTDGILKMRIILDTYSMEIFINDGEQAASFVLYTPIEASAIKFSSDGSVLVDVEKYELVVEQ